MSTLQWTIEFTVESRDALFPFVIDRLRAMVDDALAIAFAPKATMRRFAPRLLLFATALIGSLLAAETALRWSGFSFRLAPERVEFGWPGPVSLRDRYLSDPDLFWVPHDYWRKLEHMASRPPDLLFVGDSCTEFGSYPRRFAERVAAHHPDLDLVIAKLGVGGWSSYQGLQQMKRDVVRLRPRIVSFYYGWNDHWIGFGVQDKEIHTLRTASLPGFGELRIAQLLLRAQLALRAGRETARVAPEDFRSNLREMVRLARAHGIVPLLLTAPTSHEVGREPRYLSERFLRDLSHLVPMHESYVAIARGVAREQSAPLCDLAAEFAALPRDELRTRYFRDDGIHLRREGNEKIAEFLYDCFRRDAELRSLW